MQTNIWLKKIVDLKGQNPFNTPHAQIAQSVEQRIENPRVGGSIPPPGTTILKALHFVRGFLVSDGVPDLYQSSHQRYKPLVSSAR